MRIYIATPLFTAAEKEFNAMLARELRRRKHVVFLPQETEADISSPVAIFRSDLYGLNMADCVLAGLDGSDVDSGTAWEVGYAYAQRKTVFGLRTDNRLAEKGCPVNIMLNESVDRMFHTVEALLEAFDQ
jgi:nucleoside 2-deoxyribosyltransferase